MTPFRPSRKGYVARLSAVERRVLARVATDVVTLLRRETGADEQDATAAPGAALPGLTPFSVGAERAPIDPAALRLLPDASRDDPSLAAEFRHYTQQDLAAAKTARLARLAGLLREGTDTSAGVDEIVADARETPFVVPRDAAEDVAGALTDVRLVLADRLDLETDAQVEELHDEVLGDAPDPQDEEAAEHRFAAGVFLVAGLLQESLVEGMLADLRAGHRPGAVGDATGPA